MKCSSARDLLKVIDDTVSDIQSFQCSARERAYLANFLAVLICGVYEEAIEIMLAERFASSSQPQISKFLESYFQDYFRNPNFEKLIELLGRFDGVWADTLKRTIPPVQSDALDSIIDNKNLLAHKGITNLDLARVIDFYGRSRPIIEQIDEILWPDSSTESDEV